jgi:glutathione synthase/RimK-type ligase-like ATP-grasp enzyme
MRVELAFATGGRVTGTVVHSAGEIDLAQVEAAYVRPMETGRACGITTSDDPALARAMRADHALVAWADLSGARIVNRPAAMAANNSKPFQLAQIAAHGFAVPDTMVTTDPAEALRFLGRHGRVVYKSVSGVRSIVAQLHRDTASLANVANCPTQFQEYLPGDDVRVHVVGEQVLATRILSEADDYRYASRTGDSAAMVPTELPAEVAAACVRMAAGLGLRVAGIDLRLTPTGEWYCFEVNPSPGFSFYEAVTGQPISAAIAALLVAA